MEDTSTPQDQHGPLGMRPLGPALARPKSHGKEEVPVIQNNQEQSLPIPSAFTGEAHLEETEKARNPLAGRIAPTTSAILDAPPLPSVILENSTEKEIMKAMKKRQKQADRMSRVLTEAGVNDDTSHSKRSGSFLLPYSACFRDYLVILFEQAQTLENCLAIAGAGSLNWAALFSEEEQERLTTWAKEKKTKHLEQEEKANCVIL